MAIARPILSVWTPSDSNIRQFQQGVGGGNFVQIDISSLPQVSSNNPTPFMDYVNNGDTLVTFALEGATQPFFRSWSMLPLTKVALSTDPAITNSIKYATALSKKSSLFIGVQGSIGGANRNANYVSPSNSISSGGGVLNTYGGAIFAEIHPLDLGIMLGFSGSIVYQPSSGSTVISGNTVPSFVPSTGAQPITLPGLADIPVAGRWSADGSLFIVGTASGKLYVYDWTTIQTGFGTPQIIDLNIGHAVVDIAVDRMDWHVAISWGDINIPTFQTRIFVRRGNELYPETTATITANMGRGLIFSADGLLLIDALAKICMTYDPVAGTWSDTSSIIAAIPAGVTAQAINSYTPALTQRKYTYKLGAENLAERSLNLNALKVMLLDNRAYFNFTDATMSAVSFGQQYEVVPRGWQAGGITLQNVSLQQTGNGYILQADDLKKVVVGPITFRSFLVYDSVTNVPLSLIKLSEDYTTGHANLPQLQFSLNAQGVVAYK